MQNRRFSPVALACVAAVLSISGFSVHAQTTPSLNLFNNASLSNGMTAAGARSFEQLKSVTVKTGSASSGTTPTSGVSSDTVSGNGTTATVGTSGSNNPSAVTAGAGGSGSGAGSSGSSTINGTTDMANASNNQYTYNSSGQMVSTGSGTTGGSGEFMGPPSPTQGTVIGAGTGSSEFMGPPAPGQGTTAGGMDWLKMVQIAAPVVAGISGNKNIAQIAGIAGSGAQIYGQLSSGQELTMQNYANMGNIALQTAALATNNTNIDKAAALGTLGTGAWNAYSALTPQATATAAASTGVLAGYSSTGQPIYQSATPATTAASTTNWGAIASIAQTTAPALGNITGNATIGQLGQAAGLTGQVYNQTGGFNNTPNTQQMAGIVSTSASQIGYMTGNQSLQQVSQVANATGQMATVYNAQGQAQQVYTAQQPVYSTNPTQVVTFSAQPPLYTTNPTQPVTFSAQPPLYTTNPTQPVTFSAQPPLYTTNGMPQQQVYAQPGTVVPSTASPIATQVNKGLSSIGSTVSGWLK